MAIEFDQPHHRVAARRRQSPRRPREDWRRATHDQRSDGTDGEAITRAGRPRRLQRGKRPIEPAAVGRAGLGQAALQHVLSIEMGAFPVRRRRRVHDRCGAGGVEAMQVGHRRIEREEGVERQRSRFAVERERAVAAQREPVRIAHRRDRRKPIQRAAQHDDQQARIAALRARNLRQIGPGKQRAGGDEQFAAGRGMKVCHRLTCSIAGASPALELGRHEQKRECLRAAFGARDGFPRFG